MDYDKTLPFAGSGVVAGTLGMSGQWLVLGALLLVSASAIAIRFGFRRDRAAIES